MNNSNGILPYFYLLDPSTEKKKSTNSNSICHKKKCLSSAMFALFSGDSTCCVKLDMWEFSNL